MESGTWDSPERRLKKDCDNIVADQRSGQSRMVPSSLYIPKSLTKNGLLSVENDFSNQATVVSF